SAANDFDPMFSADGRWLYFFSNRDGGRGGDDLYRAPVLADGGFGPAANLGTSINSAGDEWAPTPSRDGRHLLFASDGFGGAGRHDLFVARWDGDAFVEPQPVPGINGGADEFDAAWLGDGAAIVFARSENVDAKPIRLFVAQCDGQRYGDIAPLTLSFNTADAWTLAPTIDWNKPGELLVTGVARAPRAGKLDIYRIKAPVTTGRPGCQ
ncbi:MAG: TolB family protein, partial [Lysobacter sp.]